MTAPQILVQLAVVSNDPDQIARAVEAMARTTAGLVLEGITAQITAATVPEETNE